MELPTGLEPATSSLPFKHVGFIYRFCDLFCFIANAKNELKNVFCLLCFMNDYFYRLQFRLQFIRWRCLFLTGFNELTKDEEDLIYAFILLPLARRVLENDMRAIEVSRIKFKEPYILLIEDALKRLSINLRDVKADVRRQQIKMIRHGDLDYEAVVRGWTHQVVFHHNFASEWVEDKISELLNKQHP